MADNIARREARYTRNMMRVSLVLAAIATATFLTNPEIDLVIAREFFGKETGFIFNQSTPIYYVRRAIIFGYAFWYAAIVGLLIWAILDVKNTNAQYKQYGLLKLSLTQLIYLVATSLAGPLLAANIILKNNWGRARPRQIFEFNGNQEFSPPLLMSDQCQTNCSFVSGEPASMFMIFFALSFVIPNHRRTLLILAIFLGSLSGVMRMGQGGHFFSDVIFAGLFMAMIASAIYWLMFVRPARDSTKITSA